MKASSSYVLRVSEVVDRNSLGQRLRNPDTMSGAFGFVATPSPGVNDAESLIRYRERPAASV